MKKTAGFELRAWYNIGAKILKREDAHEEWNVDGYTIC